MVEATEKRETIGLEEVIDIETETETEIHLGLVEVEIEGEDNKFTPYSSHIKSLGFNFSFNLTVILFKSISVLPT